VGASGTSGVRCAEVTASTRRRPARICAFAAALSTITIGTSPATAALTAGAPPL